MPSTTLMKCLSGSASPMSRRNVGYRLVEPNDPDRNAIGRRITVTIADAPSAERISAAAARPSPANVATPRSRIGRSDRTWCGPRVPKSALPMTNSATVCSANTTRVDPRTAARYAAGGRGVERRRFRIPPSRRITSWMAIPEKAVFATP